VLPEPSAIHSQGAAGANRGRPRGTRAVIGIFALLSLVPVIALGVGLGDVINSGVQQQNLAEANRNAVVLAQAGIQPLLEPSDLTVGASNLTSGLANSRLDQLDNSLRGVAFGKVVARLKIWNRQGVVVYSDNRSLVGRAFPADEHLDMALAGNSASEISTATSPENRDDNLTGTFLSVYVPLYFANDPKTPAGVFELYLPWGPVAAQIDQESHHLYLLLAIGLSLLYLSMLPVLLVAEQWRRRLTTSLDSADREHLTSAETARVSELKSSFLASMSHEMRTPLNAVLGYAQLLRTPDFGELNERQDKYVQKIASAGRHLLALTNDVLDLSKIEAGRMDLDLADIDLGPLVADAVEMVSPLAEAKSLSLSVEPFELAVKADHLRLTQVLTNLLSNAVKATPAEGSVTVSALQSSDWVEITVADTGGGIPSDEQAAVFENYTQGSDRSRGDGTGLGLPLSRRLIELMQGELDLVESTPLGSTFRIRIPAARLGLAGEDHPAQLEPVAVNAVPGGLPDELLSGSRGRRPDPGRQHDVLTGGRRRSPHR
jgi:two-component system, cell cycle sensor histidine kinase PleC